MKPAQSLILSTHSPRKAPPRKALPRNAPPRNAMSQRPPHHLLLSWLILSGLIGAALFIAWEQELLLRLFLLDKSRLSWLIALVYVLLTLHCLCRIVRISEEHRNTQNVAALLERAGPRNLRTDGQGLYLNDAALPHCVITDYARSLHSSRNGRNERSADNGGEPGAADNRELLEVYETALKGPQEIGWFAADVMLKLGLLGTIIGFIFMLGSVSEVSDFDVGTMQEILRQMGTGMGTALYTTLAGLVCSVLASMQYHMLDRHCDEIVMMLRRLAQTHIKPAL